MQAHTLPTAVKRELDRLADIIACQVAACDDEPCWVCGACEEGAYELCYGY